MRGSKFAALRRTLLTPLAESVGLDYDIETIRPGNAPVQLSYAFASCGGDLLTGLADPDRVPSLDKGVRKRVAKAVARGLGSEGGRYAAVFLAQAYATQYYESLRLRGHKADAERHLGFRRLIQEHFPLPDELVARLDATRAEFRTLENHQVRDEVRAGVERGTGYHRALLDSDFLDGRDPDEDEELVMIQTLHAGNFLRGRAGLGALELAIGQNAFAEAKSKLMVPGGPDGYDGLVVTQLEHVRWVSVAQAWSRHMHRALGVTLPEDDELDDGLRDQIVAGLSREIVRLLEVGELAPLPEQSQQAMAHFANEMAASAVDWDVATDALLMGYSLRAAERNLPNPTAFDERSFSQLHEFASKEADIALVGFAANVAESLPAPFCEGDWRWAHLSAWAVRRALERDQARRNAGMEEGDRPTLSAQDCERAFGLGYGVRYVEEALNAGRDTEIGGAR